MPVPDLVPTFLSAPLWRVTPRPAHPRSARGLPACAAAALLVALLAGCSKDPAAAGGAKSAASKPGGAAPEVSYVVLSARPVTLTTELSGRTRAAEVAEIRPQVTGVIKERLFTEGAMVRAGQPLYRLDDASYRSAGEQADAALARARATLRASELTARRQRELLAVDATSRQEHDEAQAAMQRARADVQTAQAQRNAAGLDLGRAVIRSPISGRVDTSTVTAGALVTANQTTALTRVQRLDPMWLDLPQGSGELLALQRRLRGGGLQAQEGRARARLLLEDGSTYPHEATLEAAGVSVDPGTGAVTLRARVPNPQGILLPGMYVKALLDQGTVQNAVLAPQAGIQRDARGGATAWVVGADGKAQMRPVKVADVVDGQWRVTEGLAAGDRLVIEGTQRLRPGSAVRAVPFTANVAAGAAGKASGPVAAAAAAAATAALASAPAPAPASVPSR